MLLLISVIPVTVILIALLVMRPNLTAARGGKVLAFLALFALPGLMLAAGAEHHLEQSKSTEFCISCHVMEPYYESLHLDDKEFIPANHYQNNLVPRDKACFTCHTTYAMYGDIKAKFNGLKHLWVYYFEDTPEKIELYEPYQSRECLHCHEGSRSYVEAETHKDAAEDLASGQITCLECHEKTHSVHDLSGLPRWKPEPK
jgi:nitrate/TMAO reductase-like tetraheme cytochrome c subunit